MSDYNYREFKQDAKTGLKWYIWLLLLILAFSLIGVLFRFVFFPIHVVNKAQETAYGVVDKTLNADNALFNYENFKDMYANAKAQVMNIAKAQKSLDDLKKTYGDDALKWPKDVRTNAAFFQENIDGYNMQYQSIVKRYNADSTKLNRNLFKDKGLLPELPLDPANLDISK